MWRYGSVPWNKHKQESTFLSVLSVVTVSASWSNLLVTCLPQPQRVAQPGKRMGFLRDFSPCPGAQTGRGEPGHQGAEMKAWQPVISATGKAVWIWTHNVGGGAGDAQHRDPWQAWSQRLQARTSGRSLWISVSALLYRYSDGSDGYPRLHLDLRMNLWSQALPGGLAQFPALGLGSDQSLSILL